MFKHFYSHVQYWNVHVNSNSVNVRAHVKYVLDTNVRAACEDGSARGLCFNRSRRCR